MNKHALTLLHGVIGVTLPVGVISVLSSSRDVNAAAVVIGGILALAMPSIIATRVSWAAGHAAGMKEATTRLVGADVDARLELTGPVETRIKR